MPNLNEDVRDRAIRHAVFLERYKSSEVKRIRNVLDRVVIPDIQDQVESRMRKSLEIGFDTGRATTKRLVKLEKAFVKISKTLSGGFSKELEKNLRELSDDESLWQVGMIKEEVGIPFDFELPAPATVYQATLKTPFSGFTLRQWYDTLDNSLQKRLTESVQRSVIEGESIGQATRRIRGTRALGFTDGVLQTTRRQAETVARSAIQHISNQARLAVFEENKDLISGLQWVATLDSRTSLTCASLDGRVFPIDKGPRPPIHPNCRSTMTAVLKDADGLGLPEGTRASIDGAVPVSETYGVWLRKQPVSVQRQVLGKTRADLFKNGKLTIDKFTDSNFEPLNLQELRKLEKGAFKKAGLDV